MKFRHIFILAAILLPYALFGLSPTGLVTIPDVIRNHARAGDGNAVRFPAPGIVKIPKGADWLEAVYRNDRFVIDLRVVPASVRARGPARILTMSLNPAERNLTVGQERDALVVRMRRPGTDLNGMPDISIPRVFLTGQAVDIRVAYAGGELLIDVDGRTAARVLVMPGALTTWSSDYEMALGNEFTMDRPWLGNIERAVIRSGSADFDLLANENHRNPAFLLLGSRYGFGRQSDVVVNFLGFIPLGIFLMLRFRPRGWPAIVFIILAMGSISAGIEIIQLTLPGRTPSLRDFGLNVSGGVTGLVLAAWFTRRRSNRNLRPAAEGAD